MKKIILVVITIAFSANLSFAQSFADLSKEDKLMKMKEFRADNQNFLRDMGLTDDQLSDIDDVNVCYLTTLDRIDRYGTDEEKKTQFAKAATAARSMQLDAIMGQENRQKYMEYVMGKLEKLE